MRHNAAGCGIGPAALDRGPQRLALGSVVVFWRG
jgi:hypothetical protein